jgi:hypothetical protein
MRGRNLNAVSDILKLQDALDDLVDTAEALRQPGATPDVATLGLLHRALEVALTETRAALEPAIHAGQRRGMTYLELALASGYGSTTTISKIMKLAPNGPPGTGNNPPSFRAPRRAKA